ncbi:MAG TPA: F0F1 ATP synthase subunit delta [Gammaproteobacteria bacterium]|jgi:F-type H+-transporting ATPase subunit delta|nr:F0F1 ATP synthase subunit delta [Gammaproteobacteria bacterium]
MQEDTTIARPYAQAAFECAREQGQLEAWSKMLSFLSLLVADPTMRKIIQDPRIPRARLLELIFDIGGEYLLEQGRNFLKLLVEAGRIQLAPAIARLYEELRAEAERVVDVNVITAYALDNTQEQVIAEAVKKRTGKNVKVSTLVDRGLIGGVVVRIGDRVIDASVRGRLQQLASQLA